MLRSVPESKVDVVAPSAGIVVAGTPLVADHEGALSWEREGLLALADLHLEKGSSFARRGVSACRPTTRPAHCLGSPVSSTATLLES